MKDPVSRFGIRAARLALALLLLAGIGRPAPAGGAPPPKDASAPGGTLPAIEPEYVEVTATRIAEDVETVPASMTIVTGDDLRNRGARDLREALALATGVNIAPGGDGGPASSVVQIWGLQEFDAFLLVVDGIPWGGAFNPSIATLDLADVERIEVLRGPAPVMCGATSFVGISATGIASTFGYTTNDTGDKYLIAMYDVAAIKGSGEFLVVTYDLTGAASGLPFGVTAQANEGHILVVPGPGIPRGGTHDPNVHVDAP